MSATRTSLVSTAMLGWVLVIGIAPGWLENPVRADTVPEYYDRITRIRGNSRAAEVPLDRIIDDPTATQAQKNRALRARDALWDREDAREDLAYDRYRFQQSLPGRIGGVEIAGLSPVARLQDGSTATLTFQFIDPITGLPNPGPMISSVLYEANLDPASPTVFVPIGMSNNQDTDFSISFTVAGYEPVIQAIPMDSQGSPIDIEGAGGFNVAIGFAGIIPPAAVPEPSTIIPLGIGILGVLGYAWHRRRRVA